MATVSELRVQAKARKIPKYYRMSKPQLMGALGVTAQSARPKGDARARSTAKQHGIAKSFAADKIGGKLGGGDEAKKAAIKTRIVKSVSRELKAHEKKIGRKLTIEEKRGVAVKALASEVRAIKSGVPEQKGKTKLTAVDGGKKHMTPIEGGNKTGVESLPTRMRKLDKKLHQQGVISKKESEKHQHLKSVEGGQTSLKDLYKEADRVGSKYQDKHDPADMGAHRQAKKIVAESGMGELHDRVTGKKTKRQSDKARMSVVDGGKKPERVSRSEAVRGGSLATRGGNLTQGKAEEKQKSKSNPHPKDSQAYIDAKHTIGKPDDKSVETWMHETAIAASRPTDAAIHARTLDGQQRRAGIHPSFFDKPSAKIAAVHDKASWAEAADTKEQKSKDKPKSTKPKKERIAELNARYDESFDAIKKSMTAVHEEVKKGGKDEIGSALNKAKISPNGYKGEPIDFLHFAWDHNLKDPKEVAAKYLNEVYQKNGGDIKALGLKSGADFTVKELKDAYRSAAQKAHPDRGGSADKFRALKESYERLMPKAKSPALDKVAAETGMTREEVAKAVKRRKARA